MTAEYWNHNTQFHAEIVRLAARLHGDVLDVGCGDGLLLERLAPASRSVTGIDPDAAAIARAATRRIPSADLRVTTFADYDPGAARFDLVTFVATLHHLPLEAALERARDLLRPGGRLVVIGLAAIAGPADFLANSVALVPTRLGDLIHGPARNPDVALVDPVESFAEIRAVARVVLPGARLRRRLYWRYSLDWTCPEG